MDIGKAAGIDSLRTTLSLMQPVRKPTEVIRQTDAPRDDEPKTYAKLSDVPADQLEKLREERRRITNACTKPSTGMTFQRNNQLTTKSNETFKYLFTAVLALIASVALNSAAGATLACVAGFPPPLVRWRVTWRACLQVRPAAWVRLCHCIYRNLDG